MMNIGDFLENLKAFWIVEIAIHFTSIVQSFQVILKGFLGLFVELGCHISELYVDFDG